MYFKFPSFDPRSKSIIVLKNTKEDGGSDRNCYLPETFYKKLLRLKELQAEFKEILGSDGYADNFERTCRMMKSTMNTSVQDVSAPTARIFKLNYLADRIFVAYEPFHSI